MEVWSEEEENFIIEKSLVLIIPKSLFGILITSKQRLLAIGGENKYNKYEESFLPQMIDSKIMQYSLECAKNSVSNNSDWEH